VKNKNGIPYKWEIKRKKTKNNRLYMFVRIQKPAKLEYRELKRLPSAQHGISKQTNR